MKSNVSPLQAARVTYKPKLPKVLMGSPSKVAAKTGKSTRSISDQAAIQELFPSTYGQPEISFVSGKGVAILKKQCKVALVLSGGQAPGGHNVVAGLFDGLKKLNPKNTLTGYLGGLRVWLRIKSWKSLANCWRAIATRVGLTSWVPAEPSWKRKNNSRLSKRTLFLRA